MSFFIILTIFTNCGQMHFNKDYLVYHLHHFHHLISHNDHPTDETNDSFFSFGNFFKIQDTFDMQSWPHFGTY